MTGSHSQLEPRAKDATRKLLAYCRSMDWAGIDPYDALNSRVFQLVPFLDHRIPRLAMTQALKRSPVNIRPLLLVPPTQNPKSFGVFLKAMRKLSGIGWPGAEEQAAWFVGKLEEMRAPGKPYACWGYSFPWQTRTLLVPRGTPNLVCTTFIADALLDVYEQTGERRCLELAASGAEFIYRELYWSEGNGAGFGYPLACMRHQVHNANLLGAALFCRVAQHTGSKEYLDPALKVTRYSVSRQRADGSWFYGERHTQKWIDNFHTGYNLWALQSMARTLATSEFDASIRRGFEFYRNHFFHEDGVAKYFHDCTHPIDIHCVAQSILSLLSFPDIDGPRNERMARAVLSWALDHMWDDKGFFHYRVLRLCTIRTSYMRWSQAWMLLALAHYLEAISDESVTEAARAHETVGALS